MRHRVRGRKLGRNPSHRKAMFRNMACSLIRSVRIDEEAPNSPNVPGRIVTTVAKAKELRPFVEKLVTLARNAVKHQENATQYETSAERNSSEWKSWRDSEQWNKWNQAIAPAVACRRRAFAALRDNEAVDILFDELAERFADRPGGYTRIVKLANVRLGDAGKQALIEFVGERDRAKTKRKAPVVAVVEETAETDVTEETLEAETETTEETTEAVDAEPTAKAEETESVDEEEQNKQN